MSTIFSKLQVPLAAAYILQVGAACLFVPLQTEKFYDLTGATGHLVCAGVSLYGPSVYQHYKAGRALSAFRPPPLNAFAPRQLIITFALASWAARLGTFLFQRISKDGKDSRFDKIKVKPTRFFLSWVIQGTWVALIGLPIWLTNAVPLGLTRPWGPWDTAITAVAALSWGVEILADRQKTVWKKEQREGKHHEKFITSGLWAWSRHPNYIGEVAFQTSLFALACRSLVAPGIPSTAVGLAAISPVFTYLILRYLSGVPPLERGANKKWGDDPAWKAYKHKTPVFWPWARIYD